MSTIAIIIPYYKGKKYINSLLGNIAEAVNYAEKKIQITFEVIIVNDSPEEYLEVSDLYFSNLNIIINEKNSGIHYSRVKGICTSNSKYIYMIDQDDKVEKDIFVIQYLLAERYGADCVLGNGYKENEEGKMPIYSNKHQVILASDYATLYSYGCMIKSPGQCLIRKESIPHYWLENILDINCSDDYYLWLLLFPNGRIVGHEYKIYTHIYTGENYSLNKLNMLQSEEKVYELLKKSGMVSPVYLHGYHYRHRNEKGILTGEIRNSYFHKASLYLLRLVYKIIRKRKFVYASLNDLEIVEKGV